GHSAGGGRSHRRWATPFVLGDRVDLADEPGQLVRVDAHSGGIQTLAQLVGDLRRTGAVAPGCRRRHGLPRGLPRGAHLLVGVLAHRGLLSLALWWTPRTYPGLGVPTPARSGLFFRRGAAMTALRAAPVGSAGREQLVVQSHRGGRPHPQV